MPMRVTVNESAPRSDTMASDTAALTPVSSATTVMIDETATMLPSSVSIDRSLLAQIDCSASTTDSKICDIGVYCGGAPGRCAVRTGSPTYMPRTESNGPVMT